MILSLAEALARYPYLDVQHCTSPHHLDGADPEPIAMIIRREARYLICESCHADPQYDDETGA